MPMPEDKDRLSITYTFGSSLAAAAALLYVEETFELIQKKVIDDIYKKLTETDSPDAITIQELND